ncbi:MAG: DUF4492 domain-containing protein [Bacteroidales bacterium]|jgi:uncharacterized membrane protein|nr:DUF4492 domain-containing protein [Bacteroidales bacterium]NCC17749.1 DUF4492 domain-containing protein [Bacteroidia bacterium]MDD2577021.1 DUF4492 domain-containing protein [Bacteroidales bacterium]MDD3286252.1 DUF4492 domain-containing protein [Bacteroidales bacterium]MDD3668547.1 DUF4492 domain-containing protein [Bacteroidales bacterium]
MNVFKKVFLFYYQGFRSMTLGKTLWMIILIKLFIMFAILKVFFFPNFLSSKGDSKEEKSEYIVNEMEKRTINN